MDRRNFLGSVIGLVGGAAISVPFFARLLTEPAQVIEQLKVIEEYQILFRDSMSGFTIRAPGIKDVIAKYESWQFVAHPLNVRRTMRVDQAILLDKNGAPLSPPSPFSCPIAAIDGDLLKVTFTKTIQGCGTDDFKKSDVTRNSS